MWGVPGEWTPSRHCGNGTPREDSLISSKRRSYIPAFAAMGPRSRARTQKRVSENAKSR